MKIVRVTNHLPQTSEYECLIAEMVYPSTFRFQFKHNEKSFAELVGELTEVSNISVNNTKTGKVEIYTKPFYISSIEKNGSFYTVSLIY